MAQQPFTPDGVQQKQAELNQLSQSDLQAQANLISSDLRSWVSDNFSLDQNQQAYLTAMADQFISYAANLTAFAVVNKLPVTLTVEPQKPFKLIHVIDSIDCVTSPNGFSVTGGVTYEVEFQ